MSENSIFSKNRYYLKQDIKNLTKPAARKLQNEKDFLVYLDEEEILKELEVAAIQYEKTVSKWLQKDHFNPPFRFRLKLDIMKIQEISENLMHMFTKEIEAGMNLAKKVFLCGLQLLLPNVLVEHSNIQLIPFVINLPVTCEILELLQFPSLGLECVQGVLLSKTTMVKYVRSSVYSCESRYCPRNKWQRYPENFKNICPSCLNLMEKDVLSTDTGEEFICQIISLKAFQNSGRFQVLNVRIKDELCTLTDFCIGEEYKITGKLTENFFEAVHVTFIQPIMEMNLQYTIFPKSIMSLYNRVNGIFPNCPWSFVYALSSSLSSHLIPESSYLHLKMGLLLSLSSQTNDEAFCPLVAIGPDTVNTQHLLHIAGKLAERYVRYSIAHSYLGGAAKPGFHADVIWLEAGQLIFATKGVCNLGDWSKFKKEQANYICQTIESGQIVLNKGELGKINLIDFVPLKCAVWTYWCHITTSSSHQLQLKTLINVFGIPFLADERKESEVKKVCRKNLEKGRKGSDSTKTSIDIPTEDLREFIKIINTKELCLSDSAAQLIRKYFVLSRRERPYCLPIGAIKTITSLAEAHARLALRNEVLYDDVVSILYLYEESISALFGESMNPHPKLTWNEKDPIFVFMGKQLQQFRAWLEGYVSM